MSDQGKWKSNKDGGGVFIIMSDNSTVFVAEALGATKEIKVKRAAFIALSANVHYALVAACEALAEAIPEENMDNMDAPDFKDRAYTIFAAARKSKAALKLAKGE